MLLHALNEYARRNLLVESIELTTRTVHLVLKLRSDGTVEPGSPWMRLESPDPKDKKGQKWVLGKAMTLPRFPGEKNGPFADFLADPCSNVLGIDPERGKAVPDDPKLGENLAERLQAKRFAHFWEKIRDAYASTSLPDLKAMLEFRERYLSTPELRNSPGIVGLVPFGKKTEPVFCALTENEPTPLAGKLITFSVEGRRPFELDGPLHHYWRDAFRRAAFKGAATTAGRGLCLVTGLDDEPIAGSHKPEIKGVPGLPMKGGYLVSIGGSSESFGFEGNRNAPVSEQAVAGYALALNALLASPQAARRMGGGVLVTWLREHPEEGTIVRNLLDEPTADAVEKYLKSFDEGQPRHALRPDRYYSLTLAANGGRVVVRRWLDTALGEAVDQLKRWFADLEIEEIRRPIPKAAKTPPKAGDAAERAESLPYRSILRLAWSTARTPSDVGVEVFDALHRAAFEGGNVEALLPPTLHRLRIAAVKSGSGVRFQTSRFALLKLILKRLPKEAQPLTIERQLCETHDAPYNCGRLLAILDDIQFAAQGDVGADIIARFYGNASTFPRNSLGRLLTLARVHLNKLGKDGDGRKVAAGHALERKLFDVTALFKAEPDAAPEFPGQLTPREQGRFALGFHQQKAKDQRDRDAHKAALLAVQEKDDDEK